jgi:hypothetical protein
MYCIFSCIMRNINSLRFCQRTIRELLFGRKIKPHRIFEIQGKLFLFNEFFIDESIYCFQHTLKIIRMLFVQINRK